LKVTTHTDNYNYQYNGLGDRVQQTVKGVTTTYVLDLNVGLTQVLNEGTDTYLYGLSRIGEESIAWDYFLGDALGSVRQLTEGTGVVSLAQTFEPYGEIWASYGNGSSSYSFSGEAIDPSGLIFLRARYMDPSVGRFISRDTWMGDYNRPMSLNRWMYVEGNPVNFIDPSGMISEDITERQIADRYLKYLQSYYVEIVKDWGYSDIVSPHGYVSGCYWKEGNWRSWEEIKSVYDAVVEIHDYLNKDFNKLFSMFGNRPVQIKRTEEPQYNWAIGNHAGLVLPPWLLGADGMSLPNNIFDSSNKDYTVYTIIHEFGHVVDLRRDLDISLGMANLLGNMKQDDYQKCISRFTVIGSFICGRKSYTYNPANEIAPGYQPNLYADNSFAEDWAEAFASTIFPQYWGNLAANNSDYETIGFKRETYVNVILSLYP